MILPEDLTALLAPAFPDGHVHINDLTGTRDHYEAVIVSSSFVGQRPLERHRRVYAALGTAVGTQIHALALQTLTPDEARLSGQKA